MPKLLWGGDDHDESFVATVDAQSTRRDVSEVRGAIEITRRDGSRCSTSLSDAPRLIAWAYPPIGSGWWEMLEPEAPQLASEVISSGRRYWVRDAIECRGFGWATRPGVVLSYVPGEKADSARSDLRAAARWDKWQKEYEAFRAGLDAPSKLPANWDALAGWEKSWNLRSAGLELTATCFGRFHEEESARGQARFERNGMIVSDAAGKVLPVDWVPSTLDESCGDFGVLRTENAQPIITFSTDRGYGAFGFDGSRLVPLPLLSVGGR